MKLLLLCLCFVTLSTNAQTLLEASKGQYYWKNEVFIISCDQNGKIDTTETESKRKILSEVGQKFNVVDFVNNTVDSKPQRFAIIKVINYDDKDKSNYYKYNYKKPVAPDTVDIQRYFKVLESELLTSATKFNRVGAALSGGIISFPYKFRIQKKGNDFSGAFNLGAAMGVKLPHWDYSSFTYSLLFAATYTTINLDASSVSRNSQKLLETNDFSALSFAIGGLVEYERFQAGLFIGLDKLSTLNNETFGWKYQNKPWVSVGFGYTIFSVDKENAKGKESQ